MAASLLGASTLALTSSAQTITNVIDGFDPSGVKGNSYSSGQITNVWMNWFGGAFRSLTWDGSSDANSNSASGSMKITVNFGGTGSDPDEFEIYDGLTGISPPLNGLQYTNFQCDVRFDPSSATVINGGVPVYGYLQFGIATPTYYEDYFGAVIVPASNTNWIHVSLPLNAVTDTNLTNIADVLIHIWGPYLGSPGLSGQSIFWVDNIKFIGTAPAPTNCVVNWNDTHQRIDGFGASCAWNTTLTPAQMDMFYSTNTGIGLSLLRNRIAPDGTTGESNYMQEAQARGARIWSTPWSPPAAYKDSGSVNGGDFVSSNYQAYANQLANYVLSVKINLGINLYAVSIQNEPDQNTTYESCLWTAQQFHDFLPYLYNALSNNGVGSTKILMPEFSNWNFDIASNALADPVTSNMVGVLAGHDYTYTVSPVNNGNLPLWETEVSTFDTFDGTIGNGLYWAGQIHGFMTVAQANAWHYWALTQIDGETDNEDLTDQYGNPAKRMYVLGNYSRFVRPNYYRVGVSNNAPTLISAYKDPASSNFAIVAINTLPGDYVQTFNLAGFATPVVTPWVTSASLSLANQPAIAVSNSTFVYDLPAMSVVTFVGQAGTFVPTLAVQVSRIGRCGLTINGPAGGSYTIWDSTDMVHWQSLATTNLAVTPTRWVDPNLVAGTRFYRVTLAQ